MVEIKARQKNRVVILDLAGSIDADSANFVEIIGQCIRDGYTDILCNFEEVNLINYMGVSVIVIAYKDVINNHGRMKFVNVPVHLKGTFSIAGLDKVIEMYQEEEMALSSFKEDKIIEKIKKMQLRRRFKRLPIDIHAEIKDRYDKTAVCLKIEVLNLSGVGAFIFGCDKFKLGDCLTLKLNLPPKNEEIELEAKVVWLPDKQIQLHFHPGMGVEFHNISTAAQQKLLEFIERNLSFMATD